MQYGISRLFLLLITYSIIYLSCCKENDVDTTAQESQQVKREQNTGYINLTNDSMFYNRKKSFSKSNLTKRFIRARKRYGTLGKTSDNIGKIERCRLNKSRIGPNTEEKPVKHSFIDEYEDEGDDLHMLLEEDTEEPLKHDDRLPLYEPSHQDITVILDDIDMLIDKFEKVSKGLDMRHRKLTRAPLDRSNQDILMWENTNRLAWKSRQHSSTEWSEWSEWSPCSVSCGQGIRMRSRYKMTENVPAEVEELQEKKCIMPDCPPFNLARLISKVFFVS